MGREVGSCATPRRDGQWSSAIKRQVEGGQGVYRGREEIGTFWDEWHAVWEELDIVFSETRSHGTAGSLRSAGFGAPAPLVVLNDRSGYFGSRMD